MKQELQDLIIGLKNGNEELVARTIESSRTFALNYARNLCGNEEEAIELVKESYRELIFGDDDYDSYDSFAELLQDLIKAQRSGKRNRTMAKETDVSLDPDTESLKEYCNDPRIEEVIYETLRQLDPVSKEAVLRTYGGDEATEEIARDLQCSKEEIRQLLSQAEEQIEEKAPSVLKKLHLQDLDFTKAEQFYGVLKLGKSLVDLDITGIVIDVVKDRIGDAVIEKDEDEKKDFKRFVEDLMKDSIEDWFIDRIRSYATGSALTTAGSLAGKGTLSAKATAAGTVKAALAQKAAIAATATLLATGGGYVVYHEHYRNEALKYMENTFATTMFDSMRSVTAADLKEALNVCYGLGEDFVYEDMPEETELDDFFLFWPLVKYYWPDVENNWDVIDWSKYPDNEWYPGLLASEIFIMDHDLTRGYNTKAKGISMKDFAILIMNCDKYYKK